MKKKKTKLINKSDIMKIIHMRGPVGWLLATLSMWLFGFNKVNKANERCEQYKGPEFSAHILKVAGVKRDLKPQQFDNIPQDGPFIVVANHPIGSADGMMLSAVVGTMRTDFKIMANFLLSLIPSLKESFISVNPFTEGALSGRSSLAGIRTAKAHLAEERRRKEFQEPSRFIPMSPAEWKDFLFDKKNWPYRDDMSYQDFGYIYEFAKKAEEGEWKKSSLEKVKAYLLDLL